MELRGTVAVVTGASAGLGEATAVELARRGAKVVLAARRLDRLEALAERIERHGGRAVAIRCDVGDPDQLEALPAVVAEAIGPCGILVNNAGLPARGSLEELTYEQIEQVVRVNVLGVMWGTRAFLPGMLKRGEGHVVNVASLAGRFAAPGAAVYSATKHAVVGFSRALDSGDEGPRRPGDLGQSRVRPHRRVPEGARSALLPHTDSGASCRDDRQGRARGHRARALDPAVGRLTRGVPRPDAAPVSVGCGHPRSPALRAPLLLGLGSRRR